MSTTRHQIAASGWTCQREPGWQRLGPGEWLWQGATCNWEGVHYSSCRPPQWAVPSDACASQMQTSAIQYGNPLQQSAWFARSTESPFGKPYTWPSSGTQNVPSTIDEQVVPVHVHLNFSSAPEGIRENIQCNPCRETEVLINAKAELQPSFCRGPSGTFVLQVPMVRVQLSSSCTPALDFSNQISEEFTLLFPEAAHVVFDPWANMPPGGHIRCRESRRIPVIDLPSDVSVSNAHLKADLPYGTLIIKDILATSGGWQEESRQETSETRLNYHLQAEGCMTVSTGTGRDGTNQLVADLDFTLTAYIGGAPLVLSSVPQHC